LLICINAIQYAVPETRIKLLADDAYIYRSVHVSKDEKQQNLMGNHVWLSNKVITNDIE